MSEPKPLNPTEQDALVKQIGLTLMRAAPEDWRRVVAEYRATGRYFELAAELHVADGTSRPWAPPQEVAQLFARLRAGMHREGRGSWSNARYQLDHPSSYNLDFDRAEPKWQTPPPPQAYVDEMRFFPRADENVPDWLRRRLNPPTPVFRSVRVFDGAGPNGRPSVNRPPVPEPEVAPLLAYLSNAPVAVAGRGFDADLLAADSPPVVPAGFQTDGVWIWPAGVSYYLRKYGVPPEPELVERARGRGFALPEVSEETRLAAAANIGAPAAPPGTVLPPPPPVEARPAPEQKPDPEATREPEPDATQFVEAPKFDDEPDFEPPQESTRFMPAPDFDDEPEPQHAAEQEPVEVTAERAPLDDDPEPLGRPVSVAAPLADDGPPYRVIFDSDGVPDRVDDRHLRDTYGAGMDLFAPHPTEEFAQVEDDLPEQDEQEPVAVVEPDDEPEVPTAGPDEPALFTHQQEDEPELFTHHREEERTDSFVPEAEDRPRDAMQDTMAWSPVPDEPLEHATEVTEEHPVVAVEADEPDLAEEELRTTAELDSRDLHLPERLPEHQPQHQTQHQPERLPEPAPVVPPAPVKPAVPVVEETAQFDAALFADDEPEPEPEPEPHPRQVTPEEDRELAGTRRALDDLNVPHGVYRIGGEPADRTWNLRLDGDSWEVCWFDHGPKNPVRFEKVEDASAYLVGRLVMGNFRTIPPRGQTPPAPQRPIANGFREEPRRPVPPQRPPMQAPPLPAPLPPAPTAVVPAPAPAPAPVAVQQDDPAKRKFPITPLAGEPPLTLFRHKQMFELPAGTEVDRYGDQSGNLVYVAGTPFPERSLVPSWINRPYRVYRLRRPLEVLTGVAVPWFEQPGGGTAYLLPKAVEEMIAEGVLVEITGSGDN
ncbi:glycohydrolase toxin TNT-related protein [Lentzea chajnantorensis]